MKLLLVNDYYIYEHKGKYYFENQEKHDFYYRYLRVFEEMRLVTRCLHEEQLKDTRILLDDQRIEYVPIPEFHGPKEYLDNYKAIKGILKSITEGCDCAILQLPCTIAMQASKYVIKAKLPYATEVVYDAEDGWKSEKSLIRRFLWKRIDRRMRYICHGANGVACVTEKYLQRHYFSKKNDSFVSNYSSLALDKDFYTGPRNYPLKKYLTVGHTANKIFYDGRKGHQETIKAISILKQEGIIVKVHFAGAIVDESPQKLIELATKLGVAEQISFLGFLSRSELSDYLDNTDIFVLPTKAEGLPRVLIEAMSKGIPCVASNVSGNSELIESNLLIDHNDIQELSNKLKYLITDPSKYEEISRRNFLQSKQYEASILEGRRDKFYLKLKKQGR